VERPSCFGIGNRGRDRLSRSDWWKLGAIRIRLCRPGGSNYFGRYPWSHLTKTLAVQGIALGPSGSGLPYGGPGRFPSYYADIVVSTSWPAGFLVFWSLKRLQPHRGTKCHSCFHCHGRADCPVPGYVRQAGHMVVAEFTEPLRGAAVDTDSWSVDFCTCRCCGMGSVYAPEDQLENEFGVARCQLASRVAPDLVSVNGQGCGCCCGSS